MEETIATTETQPFLGEDWFDPLETAVRGRIRGFIEEMLEAELHAAMQRGRYDRQGTTRGHRQSFPFCAPWQSFSRAGRCLRSGHAGQRG